MNYIAILIVAASTVVGPVSPQLIESPTPLTFKACMAEAARAAPIKVAEGYVVLGAGCVTREAADKMKRALGQ